MDLDLDVRTKTKDKKKKREGFFTCSVSPKKELFGGAKVKCLTVGAHTHTHTYIYEDSLSFEGVRGTAESHCEKTLRSRRGSTIQEAAR